jgi:hypothetical protein
MKLSFALSEIIVGTFQPMGSKRSSKTCFEKL